MNKVQKVEVKENIFMEFESDLDTVACCQIKCVGQYEINCLDCIFHKKISIEKENLNIIEEEKKEMSKEKKLVKLLDGALINIKDNSSINEVGCPTCGMDTVYTNEIIFEFKNTKPVKMERTQYDDWSGDCGLISIGQMIRIFVNYKEEMEKLKESEFVPFIADILIKEADEKDTSISIDINGQYYK